MRGRSVIGWKGNACLIMIVYEIEDSDGMIKRLIQKGRKSDGARRISWDVWKGGSYQSRLCKNVEVSKKTVSVL